jgi:2,3-bisphosphoglycerate-independent phosphoglycerate mutase
MKKIDIKNKLVVFLTIDGWGISLNTENNAIRKANIPGFKNLVANFPAIVIESPDLELSSIYKSFGLGVDLKTYNNTEKFVSVSKIISQFNLSQLKISASQDFPLISTFFNNSLERYSNEDWIIVDKKKNPLLSFFGKDALVDELIKNIKLNKYNFIFSCLSEIGLEVLNGNFLSTISAVENISESLEKIAKAVLEVDGVLVITSAYGGAEDVYNIGTGMANKKRTKNCVPFLIIGQNFEGKTIGLKEAPNNDLSLLNSQGNYMSVAPTILKILNLPITSSMSDDSFI